MRLRRSSGTPTTKPFAAITAEIIVAVESESLVRIRVTRRHSFNFTPFPILSLSLSPPPRNNSFGGGVAQRRPLAPLPSIARDRICSPSSDSLNRDWILNYMWLLQIPTNKLDGNSFFFLSKERLEKEKPKLHF